MQVSLETLFYPELANVFGTAVIGDIVRVLELFFLCRVDATDVADHMAGDLPKGVVTEQPGLDVNPGKTVALGRKTGNLFVAEPGAQGQRLKALGLIEQLAKTTALRCVDVDHLCELINRQVQIGHLGGRDLQRIGRIIGGEHNPLAVNDQAPVGHHRNNGRAVVLGLLEQVLVAQHLQIDQPCCQQEKAAQHNQAGHQHPLAEAAKLGFNVAQFGHGRRPAKVFTLQGPMGIAVRGAALRQQQQNAHGWPEQRLQQRREQQGQAREPAACSHAHPELDGM